MMDFKFEVPELPRTTTKTEWKKISHWLRVCAKSVRGEISCEPYAVNYSFGVWNT